MLVGASLAGFLAVGFLLATGHAGFAIKVTNLIFFLLLVAVFWNLYKHEAK